MKRISALFLGLMLIICGCQQEHDPVDEKDNGKKINLSIIKTSSTSNSITITLHALGLHLDEYDTWGVAFGEASDEEQGTEVQAPGKPSDGKVDILIDGLREETSYRIRAWAEGSESERIWSSSDVDVTTKKKEAMSVRLSGTVIGSVYSVDYSTGQQSTTVNTKDNVFDGNYETYFASYDRSGTWVGLDLGTKHVIRKVGYSPRITQEHRVQLAVIQGANEPDFSDAIPIYMIKDSAESGKMHYGDIDCSRGFRYIRYVSPNDVRCNLAELEFYGFEGEGDDSRFYQFTNLPVVVINTEGAQEIVSKEDEISSNVYIISENGTKILSTSDTGVRGRGNASWLYFPKKPYRLKFDSKQSPLGAPASAKKWTLISNYSDKSLMRNILAFEISRRVGQAYTPYCHPVEVVVNGEYRGCYQLCDQVEAASGRVPAKDGYLIEVDSYAADENVMFYSWNGTPVTIKHPDEEDITQQQQDFIKTYFSQMESTALSSNFADSVNGYRKYLDLDSFLRNFIVGEFSGNPDMLWSVYMYKDAADGKLFVGPAWDHDIAFDNDYTVHPINTKHDFLFLTGARAASEAIRQVTDRIVKQDPEAKARLLELWEKACNEGNLKTLPSYLDENYNLLKESAELNFKRWPVLNDKVHMNFQALGSYDAEVQYLRKIITERIEVFDGYVRK